MEPVHAPTFGELLRRFRKAAGLTQGELAERAGLSLRGINDLERSISLTPHKETVLLLTDALDLSATERDLLYRAARRRPAPRTPTSVPPLPPLPGTTSPPLIGRTHELAQLEHHLAAVDPPLLLLAGEPGIGKSRLLQVASMQAQELGWTVLEGGCHRLSGQEPYAPLLTVLQRHLVHRSPAELRASLHGCTWLVRLLPELAESAVVPAPTWSLPLEQERRLMFGAVARYLTNVAGQAGTLIVLDDLQWAGQDAIDLLNALVRSPSERPMRFLGAYRSTEAPASSPLAHLLADLAREGLASEHTLAPLSQQEAISLLEAVLGEGKEQGLLDLLAQRTGGVPYFLVSCAQGVRAQSQEGRPPPEVPWNVMQSIRQRVSALSQTAQALLGAAAVVGREAPSSLLLEMAAQPTEEGISALEELDRSRLLVEGEGSQAHYQFPHDLIREVVLSDLSAVRQRHWHGQVAEALEKSPGDPPIEELAYHCLRAGEVEKAVLYLERAGDHARDRYAHAEAVNYYRQLVELLEPMGRASEGARLWEKLGDLLALLVRNAEALEAFEQALTILQRGGDRDGQGRTTAKIGSVWSRLGTSADRVIARMEATVAVLQGDGPSLGLAELHLELARWYERDAHARLDACRRAEECAPAAYQSALGRQWRAERAGALIVLGRLEDALAVLEELLPEARAAHDAEGLRLTLFMRAAVYLARGQFVQERQCLEEMLTLVAPRGDRTLIAQVLSRRGKNAFLQGDWTQARQDLEEALHMYPPRIYSGAAQFLPFPLGVLRQAEGRRAEARGWFAEVLRTRRGNSLLVVHWTQAALAEASILAGHPGQARARLDPYLLQGQAEEELGVTQLLPVLAWAYLALDAPERADALLRQAMSRAQAQQVRPVLAEALRIRGLLSLRQARWPEAQAALEEAQALCQVMPAPYLEAKVLYSYGLLHLAQGEPVLARARLEAALALLNRLGERLYAEHVERALTPLSPA